MTAMGEKAGLPTIRRILFCTQLGTNAAYVFRYAWVLADRLGAKIAVLHVVETLTPRQETMVEGYAGPGAIHGLLEQTEREAPPRLRRRIAEFAVRVGGRPDWEAVVDAILVAERSTMEQILRHVESLRADLVVMGAHAESSVVEALLGSTARRVIRRCPVPVLTVQVPEGQQELTERD